MAKEYSDKAPHLIYLPEIPFDEKEFLEEVDKVIKLLGYATVVVGEGLKDHDHNPIGSSPFADVKKGSQVFGGASSYLADLIARKLKVRARAQDLGMVQRCFAPARSEVDEQEAYLNGRVAVRAAVAGLGGCMINITGDCSEKELNFATYHF
ncbi:hypothetical protein N752_30950 [Desulforamulus aquiferis]|nr:hypothetical protein N752_30950 [Desulforamulus aquiferis]